MDLFIELRYMRILCFVHDRITKTLTQHPRLAPTPKRSLASGELAHRLMDTVIYCTPQSAAVELETRGGCKGGERIAAALEATGGVHVYFSIWSLFVRKLSLSEKAVCEFDMKGCSNRLFNDSFQ